MLNILKNISTPSTKSTDLYKEVDLYLSIQQVSILENPLQWWRDNALRFKILSVIAKDLLSISATSAASERIFSKAGHIISQKRSSLSSKNADLLIFLAENKTK